MNLNDAQFAPLEAEEETSQGLMSGARSVLATMGTLGSIKEEAAKLRAWVSAGDQSLNLLCFLGGCFTALINLFGVFNILSPLNMVVSCYNFLFGVVIMLIELNQHVGTSALFRYPMSFLDHWAKFLSLSMGRGLFYVFVGSMMVADSGFFKPLVGAYMCVLGITCVATSFRAQTQLNEVHHKLEQAESIELELNDVNPRKTPAYIRAQFDIYDGDKDGFITARELADLCKSLGNPLDKDELAVALQMLDNDRSGRIEYDEFSHWFSGQDLSFL